MEAMDHLDFGVPGLQVNGGNPDRGCPEIHGKDPRRACRHSPVAAVSRPRSTIRAARYPTAR
jgi:hypothetical protein